MNSSFAHIFTVEMPTSRNRFNTGPTIKDTDQFIQKLKNSGFVHGGWTSATFRFVKGMK